VIPITVTSERSLMDESAPEGCSVAELYRASASGSRCAGTYWGPSCLGFVIQDGDPCSGDQDARIWLASLTEDGLMAIAPDGRVLDLPEPEALRRAAVEESSANSAPVLILTRDPEVPFADELELRAALASNEGFLAVLSAETMAWGVPSEIEPPGTRPPTALIRHDLSDLEADLRCCLGLGLEDRPDLAGHFSVAFTISERGEVSEAAERKSTLGDEEVDACLLGAIRTARFSLPSKAREVLHSFRLEPCGEGEPPEGEPSVPRDDDGVAERFCARPGDFVPRCLRYLPGEISPDDERRARQNQARHQPVIGPGALSKLVIHSRIRRHMPQLRSCYERRLDRVPELEGRVTVRFSIAPSGYVDTVNLESSELNDLTVEECLVEEIRRIHFPEPEGGGVVIVTYPFNFREI
jgi:hypothetical protein